MANSFKNRTYRPLTAITYSSLTCFTLVIVMSLMLAALGLAYVIYNEDAFSPDRSGPLAILFYGFSLAFRFEPVTRVIAVVIYLIWSYRAFNNLAPLRARNLEFSPVSAVAWWFVPFVNFVYPFQIMREVWQASDPEIINNNRETRRLSGTPDLLGVWWAAFILSVFLTVISNALSGLGQSKESLWFPSFLVLSQLVRATAAVLVMWSMIEITRRQEKRFRKLILAPATPPDPPSFDEPTPEPVVQTEVVELLPQQQ
ncbi:MAG: DUF4328 domain-containing protein [Pyrinomonadaceae bacterium]